MNIVCEQRRAQEKGVNESCNEGSCRWWKYLKFLSLLHNIKTESVILFCEILEIILYRSK